MSLTLHFVASIRWQMRGWDCRSVTNTRVMACSVPHGTSESPSPLCLIVDLTCRMRGALGSPAKTPAQINARHGGRLMWNCKHRARASSTQREPVCTACGRCLRRRGSWQTNGGRAGTKCLYPRLCPGCPPSLGRVGAGAAPGGRPATFSIRSCLLEVL